MDLVKIYCRFSATAIRLLGIRGAGLERRNAQELFRLHILIVTSLLSVSRWFSVIQLPSAPQGSSIRKYLAQIAFDLAFRFHISLGERDHQRQICRILDLEAALRTWCFAAKLWKK